MTSCWRSQSREGRVGSGLEIERPALLTTRSTPPNARTASRNAAATCASSVTSQATLDRDVGPADLPRRRLRVAGVDVGDDDAGALGREPVRDRPADPEPPPVTNATRVGERLRLRQPLELGLLERPVLDPELLGLRDRRVRRQRLGAAHHVDRVDVELAGDPRGLLVRRRSRTSRRPGRGRSPGRRRASPASRASSGARNRRGSRRDTPRGARGAGRRPPRAGAVGGRSRTSGRTLVRRKWSGHEVPSAARRGWASRDRKSRTTSLSV